METKCEQIVEADVKCDVNSELEEENEGSETDDGSECEEKSESEDRTESEERTQSEIKLDYESDAHNDSKTEIDEPLNETKAEDVREGEAPKPEAEATDENNKNTKNVQHDGEAVENGKKKLKEEKPPTKVVVRRLPPSMTKETFLEQVSPLPPVDYTYFVPADPSMGIYAFSRAYLNFITQEDLFAFTRTFDNYVFLDAKGQEYPAVVEFAPFQRVPKWRAGGGKKKDSLSGTLEADTAYQTFRDTLLAEEIELSKPGANTVKQHYFETENTSNSQEVATTPLLEFLKARRAEKARVKEERREEKRRKEAERKQKQKKRHDNSPDVKTPPSPSQVKSSGGGESCSKGGREEEDEKRGQTEAEEEKKRRVVEEAQRVARNQTNYLRRMFGLPDVGEPNRKPPLLPGGGGIVILKKEAGAAEPPTKISPPPQSKAMPKSSKNCLLWAPPKKPVEGLTPSKSKRGKKPEPVKKKADFTLSEREFPAFSSGGCGGETVSRTPSVPYSVALGSLGSEEGNRTSSKSSPDRPLGALALRPPFRRSPPDRHAQEKTCRAE